MQRQAGTREGGPYSMSFGIVIFEYSPFFLTFVARAPRVDNSLYVFYSVQMTIIGLV